MPAGPFHQPTALSELWLAVIRGDQHNQRDLYARSFLAGSTGWNSIRGLLQYSETRPIPSRCRQRIAHPPGTNQFGLHAKVKLTVGCFTWSSKPGNDERGRVVPLRVVLDVWALGTLVSHYYGPGTGYVSLGVIVIRIPTIQPQPLEAVIDCLTRMMLTVVLENVNLPFHVLSAGAFQLALESGPTIENDHVKVWGDI